MLEKKYALSDEISVDFREFERNQKITNLILPKIENNNLFKLEKKDNSAKEIQSHTKMDSQNICIKKILIQNGSISPKTAEQIIKEEIFYFQKNALFHSKMLKVLAFDIKGSQVTLITESSDLGDLCNYYLKATQQEYQKHFSATILGIVECIKYLHNAKVIHGNINPLNFFVFKNDSLFLEIKLGDFGLSNKLRSKDPNDSLSIEGNEAPELKGANSQEPSFPSDIYALGITLNCFLLRVKLNPKKEISFSPLYPTINKIIKKCLIFNTQERIGIESLFQKFSKIFF